MTEKSYISTKKRISEILEITNQYYEIGYQDKSYKAIWRKYIFPKYGICYATYLKYISVKPSELK